jgi:hypothetical protein
MVSGVKVRTQTTNTKEEFELVETAKKQNKLAVKHVEEEINEQKQ